MDNETSVLVYYNNVSLGEPSNVAMSEYDESGQNWHGPRTAIKQLPTTSQWKNVSLKNSSRNIVAETGDDTTNGGKIENSFSYEGYTARLISFYDVKDICDAGSASIGELDSCNYLLENTKYTNPSGSYGYWLEESSSKYTNMAWKVYADHRFLSNAYVHGSDVASVRPVIEVSKSDISY